MSQGLDGDLTCIAEEIYTYIFFIPHAASLVDLGKAWSGSMVLFQLQSLDRLLKLQCIIAARLVCETSTPPAICQLYIVLMMKGRNWKKKSAKCFVRSITYYCVDYIFICIHLEDTDRCPVTELESAFSR